MMDRLEELIDRAVDETRVRRQLDAQSPAEHAYTSKFLAWERRASVRAKPRRLLEDLARDEAAGRVFFPPEQVPVLAHPLVDALGPDVARRILIQRLHLYLDFTAELEQSVVNPVAREIGRRRSGLDLPERMIEDAYKIYTDEAWHAQFSDDLQRQIHRATGVGPSLPPGPLFIERLAEVEDKLDGRSRRVAGIFVAIVSETLISAILSDIPKDTRVVRPVRELVADHAIDEGRHHAYFSYLLKWAWPQLGLREQKVIGPLLPTLIQGFLEPDIAAVACILIDCELSPDDMKQVICASYGSRTDSQKNIRRAAQRTITHMRDIEILEDPAVLESFEKAELL